MSALLAAPRREAIDIGCQSYSLRGHGLRAMLEGMRKVGYRRIELWVGHADHAGGPGAAEAVRRACDEVGVTIQAYSAGGFVGAAVAVVERRLASAFAYAAALGVDLVTAVVDARAVPAVDALCRRTGMRCALENHWYTDLARTADLRRALARTSPLVGVTLDTGHLVAAREEPAAAARALGHRLWNVHLKDVAVTPRLRRWLLRAPRMEPRMLGAGEVAVAPLLQALVHAGYAGCLAIEDERDEVPLAELHAALRAAREIVRGAAADGGALPCT